MAWKAKVVNKSGVYETGEVSVGLEFFDDAEPSTILHRTTEVFPASYSLAELQKRAQQIGAEARRKRQQVDALLASIPLNAEVVI